jgi:hypothetical protein
VVARRRYWFPEILDKIKSFGKTAQAVSGNIDAREIRIGNS